MTYGGIFDAPAKSERIAELDYRSAQPGFWDDQSQAQELLKERNQLKASLDELGVVTQFLDDAEVMVELSEEEAEALLEAGESIESAEKALEKLEFRRMLGGPHDNKRPSN